MAQPLAERLRPKTLDDYIGQKHLVGPGAVLRKMIDAGRISSFILWGPPGVGKTTLAQIIANKLETPFYTLSAVTSGVKDVREVIDRAKSNRFFSQSSPILFIDEIHTLVGAGKGEGAMDAANILKPALARGELRSIGATTLDEYQKYFEKDKALERRFQTVMVAEPDTLSTISILRGLKERYENHHKVRIKDEAIIAAVELSNRYITERFLPDKAIDLMDEAAAKLRMERDSVPEELDEISRHLKQLEIEREAIKREKDESKLQQLNKEIAELKEQETSYKAKWQSEKELVNKIQQNKQEIEQLKDLQSVKEVGYLFQNPSAQMVMDTVWHEIAFGLENLGMPYEQMKRTVAEIVNYFDLQKIYHEDTDKLSGGQNNW